MTAHLIRPALLIAPIVAALALFAIPAIQVSAHAGYDHSSPGDGEVLAVAPTKIDAYFKEEMSRANGLPTLIVVNSSGDTVSSNMALDDNDRKHISADLKADLPDGRYTVIWHNVSAEDSDEAQGAFQFYIGAAPTPVPSSSPGTSAAATTP
ncbi:MAG TPA: copper resistance protein CopC, partial [Dehalococcoidia bacterium]|nr:copper resistance protein CopC [Dehalococcoidia bacterium]